MGYASSLAWIIFFIILFFTLLILKGSPMWVYYEGMKKTKGR
jgi:multiple sugar transport system permease protein